MRHRIRRGLHPTRPRHARTAHPHKPLRRATPSGRTISHDASAALASRYAPTVGHRHPTPAEAS